MILRDEWFTYSGESKILALVYAARQSPGKVAKPPLVVFVVVCSAERPEEHDSTHRRVPLRQPRSSKVR